MKLFLAAVLTHMPVVFRTRSETDGLQEFEVVSSYLGSRRKFGSLGHVVMFRVFDLLCMTSELAKIPASLLCFAD